MSDRVLVMRESRISAKFGPAEITEARNADPAFSEDSKTLFRASALVTLAPCWA